MFDLALINSRLVAILAVTARMGGFVITGPIFGSRYVPATVKAAIALYSGLFLAPMLNVAIPERLPGFVWLVSTEVLTGLCAGYAGSLVFLAIQLAGQVADTEMGFGMINVLDPMYATPIPLMGSFMYLLSLLLFLAMDGHHLAIAAMVRSYEVVPPGAAVLRAETFGAVLSQVAEVFSFGIQLSLPVMVSAFLATVGMGIIARAVPQMNVFVMGMPVKMVIGALVLSVSLEAFSGLARSLFGRGQGFLVNMLELLRP